MLKSVQISGYRSFHEITAAGLTRVNLFVGKNNCGKTSILEAIQIIASQGEPASLFRSLRRRGETFPSDESERPSEELDVSHLFYGHNGKLGSEFSIKGNNGAVIDFSCRIIEDPSRQTVLPGFDKETPFALELKLGANNSILLPLSEDGGFAYEPRRLMPLFDPTDAKTISFVPTEGLDGRNLGFLWDSIALTPEEPKIIDALKIIEPSIERIAYLGRDGFRRQAGFFVKLFEADERLPIGSLGDGMKRLLALSLAAIRASKGFLFVDEIDTGLHYTVMEEMWKLIIATAQRLEVQVFATTHSEDCVMSLARLQKSSPSIAGEASLHRLEKGLSHTIRYDTRELLTAAIQDIEVR